MSWRVVKSQSYVTKPQSPVFRENEIQKRLRSTALLLPWVSLVSRITWSSPRNRRRLSPLFRSIPWNAIDSDTIVRRSTGYPNYTGERSRYRFWPVAVFFFPGPLTRLLFREQKAIFPQKSRPHSSLVQSILQRQVADNLTCGSRRALYCLKCFQSAWTRAGSLCIEILSCSVEMRSMQKVGKDFFWNYEVLLSDRGTSLHLVLIKLLTVIQICCTSHANGP